MTAALAELKGWGWLVLFVIQGLSLWVGWSLSKKFTPRDDCGARHTKDAEAAKALEGRCQSLESRIVLAENVIRTLPTREQVHELDVKIVQLGGEQKALAAEMRGTRDSVTRVEHMLNLLTESHIKE